MSGKLRYTTVPVISSLLFLLLVVASDRAFLRDRLFIHGKNLEQEKALILDAVNIYNAILSDIYASGGIPAMLNDLPASKAVRHGLFRDIGFIRDSKRVLVYDLAEMTPIDVKITSPATAEAVVLEEWNYIYQRSDDRTPISSIKGMGQGFRYRLAKEKGKWAVTAWDPEDVEEPGKKGFYF